MKKSAIGAFWAAICLMTLTGMAHAYGGGGEKDVTAQDGQAVKQKKAVEHLTPAQLIKAFGTPEMKEKLEAQIKQKQEKLAKAVAHSNKLKKELQEAREELAQAARKAKESGKFSEADDEYFNKWKAAIHKQYAVKKAEADRLVALKNAIRAEDGFEPISAAKEKQLREYAKKEADKTFVMNQEKFADTLLKYGQEGRDEGDERDRQILRWTVVKYASMAGTAGLSGLAVVVAAGKAGIAALSTAEAVKLLSIYKAMDIAGAGVGAAADSHAQGKSATESFVRGLSASSVQALAGKVLGKWFGKSPDPTAAREALIEFASSVSVDELQSALQSATDLPAQSGKKVSPSAPNYSPPVPTQQYAM